jgi:CII-binding regulator of phage lambda lysogenization HflD
VEFDMPPSPFTETNFSELQSQVANLEDNLQKNTEETEKLTEKVSELLEVFRDFQGAQRVLEQIARVAKPLIYLLGAIAAALTWHQTSGPKG